MSTKNVPIVVTIGTITKSLSAIILLHFAIQNNRKYENMSDYFELQSATILLHSNFELLYQ